MGFCCLGVAANVCEIGINHLLEAHMWHDLPTNLQKRVPKVLYSDEGAKIQNQLARFNDGHKGEQYTFSQIAKWIDKYL